MKKKSVCDGKEQEFLAWGSLEQHLVELYAEGVISYENAVNFANDLSILDQLKDYEDEDDY